MSTILTITGAAVMSALFLALLREVVRGEVEYVTKIFLEPLLGELRLIRQANERAVGRRRREDRKKKPND